MRNQRRAGPRRHNDHERITISLHSSITAGTKLKSMPPHYCTVYDSKNKRSDLLWHQYGERNTHSSHLEAAGSSASRWTSEQRRRLGFWVYRALTQRQAGIRGLCGPSVWSPRIPPFWCPSRWDTVRRHLMVTRFVIRHHQGFRPRPHPPGAFSSLTLELTHRRLMELFSWFLLWFVVQM